MTRGSGAPLHTRTRCIIAQTRKRRRPGTPPARIERAYFPVAHVRSRRPSFVPKQRGAGRVRSCRIRGASGIRTGRGRSRCPAPKARGFDRDADRRRGPGHRRRRCRLAGRKTRAERAASRGRAAPVRHRIVDASQWEGADPARDGAARGPGESHAARGAARGIAGAAGGAGGAVPRSRAVARRNRDLRNRAGAAGREPAIAACGQCVVGAHRVAARRHQAAAPRPPAIRSAAARACARHGSAQGRAVCRHRRHEPEARSGDLRRRHAAARHGRAGASSHAGQDGAACRCSAMATGAARDLGRVEAADPHRSRRPPGGAARARRAAVFSAREPEAAPPHRPDRAARAKRRELQCRSRGGRGVDQAIFRHAGETGAVAAGDAPAACRVAHARRDARPDAEPRGIARAAARTGSRSGKSATRRDAPATR